tara:strand:+ start:149 stop:418 length:270 start_codon:yes stop_codon:yes gene_type:complete
MLISCIKDEKIVPPPVYVHPKANPKTTMVNGMKYLDDILSNAFTFSTAPIVRPSLVLIKFKHPKNYSLYSNLSSLFALNVITTSTKRSQ